MLNLLVCFFVFFSFGCTEQLVKDDNKIIYGTDLRLDYYQSTDKIQNYTRNAVVSLMKRSTLGDKNANGVYHDPASAITLRSSQRVCSNERFADQPTAAFCSGTLIGPDRVLTAGHCIDKTKCILDQTVFVFDFYVKNSAGKIAQIYGPDDVFSCRNVYSMNYESGGVVNDYAIVQLDRPVRGRTPVKVSSLFKPATLYEKLLMVGYPSGLPSKSNYGYVHNTRSNSTDYFYATTDSFGGNSGSGIMNSKGEVIGILIRGQTDYVNDYIRGCRVAAVVKCKYENCSDYTGATESVSYAFNAVAAAPECLTDADCSGSVAGFYCNRQCKTGVICCTGWCSSFRAEPNYNVSDCAQYFNYTLNDVNDPDPEFDLTGTIIAVVIVGLVIIIGVAVYRIMRRRRILGQVAISNNYYNPSQVIYSQPQPQIQYGQPQPQMQYGQPQMQYGQPQMQYGQPQMQYAPPQMQYGQPQPPIQYAPPMQYAQPQMQYAAPQMHYGQKDNEDFQATLLTKQ